MNKFTTLSDRQLEMAYSIAQYDVKAAYRYCLIINSKNQMKCPFCGQQFSRWYDQQDGSMASVCPCTPRKDRTRFQIAESLIGGSRRSELSKRCVEIPHPPVINPLEIKLSPTDYSDVVYKRKSIKIDADTAKHQAKKFKLINKISGSYVVWTLVVLGRERGYWI